ncbi:MAG: hypothetical protein GY719_34585 [bacterium]|nr:hypothetical protein [bacterium]
MISEKSTHASFFGRLRAVAVNLSLVVLSLVVFAAVVEIALRLSGFSFVLYPEEIEFGKPDPVLLEIGFLEDQDLFWVTKGYPEKLEGLRVSRPALLFMGDSCTHLGHYDEELERLVTARRGLSLRAGNLGVAGWSSYQGRRQLERDVLPLEPAVVTIYYGWNDHWIGFGIEDKNVALIKRVFSGPWSGLRLVQLATKATVAIGTRETAYPNRVSRPDFEDNLRAMANTARDAGIRPVLVTAATSHTPGQEPEHFGQRWLRDVSELVPLHRGYVDAVRRVAAEEDAILCDAAARFDALPREEIESSFMKDGIHLTTEGDRRLAEMLYDCLEREGLLELVSQ